MYTRRFFLSFRPSNDDDERTGKITMRIPPKQSAKEVQYNRIIRNTMGQQVSKAASRFSSRIGSSAVTSNKSSAGAATTRFTDPNAVLGGFQRGEGPQRDARDEGQRAFLQQQQRRGGGEDKGGEVPKEMPPDLIQFLNDVGPLKKRETSSPSSTAVAAARPKAPSRVPKFLMDDDLEDGRTEDISEESPNDVRKKESMRLAENIEGFVTERTTNFSHKKEVVDKQDFGVGNVLGLHSLLASRGKHNSDEESVQAFYEDLARDRPSSEHWEEDRERHLQLLRSTLEYVECPIILKDTNDDFIGAWPDRVEDLKRMRIVEVPKTSVKLVLEDVNSTSNANTA